MGFCGTAFANVLPPLNSELAYPVPMTAEQIVLADEELLPENVNRTFVALASDHGQKLPEEETADEPTPYFDVTFSTRRGKNPSDGYSAVNVYGEIPFGADGYSVWFSGYKDPEFKGIYAGLAKKFGNWQVGLGGGKVHYDGMSHTVTNPWVYYDSEKLEAYGHLEHYSKDSKNPFWGKAYAEWKFNPIGAGFYWEKDMGLGPRLSYKVNDHVKVWGVIPVWAQPETEKMKLFINLVLSY